MIKKPGKPPTEMSSYRFIALLPVIAELYEKQLLKRFNDIIQENHVIPDHQYGIRRKHSTIQQVHRLVHKIEKCFEERKVCDSVFLDLSQAFDKVWHDGILHKARTHYPYQYHKLITSILNEKHFHVKNDDATSQIHPITAGVPQGSVLGPFLYLLYTADLPVLEKILVVTFADDTAALSESHCPKKTNLRLQNAINQICTWCEKWRMKINETKSSHILH